LRPTVMALVFGERRRSSDVEPNHSDSVLSAFSWSLFAAHQSATSATQHSRCLTIASASCGRRGMRVGLGPGHTVLDRHPAPPSPQGHSPQFSAHICCGQMAAWIKMPLGMELGLGPGNFVLDGDPASPPKKGAEPPKFSAHVYCGQTAGWIKMVLSTEIGLSPGDFVLDGDPAPSPIFGPFLLWPNGWMHQDATWYGGRPQPRGLCVRWGPNTP